MNETTTCIQRAAIAMLARRDHSAYELTQKLKIKGYPAGMIEPLLIELAQKGFLNEQRYTENYIYSHRNKGNGPLRIARALEARGIADEMIAKHLQITDNAWFIVVRSVWQKHFKGKMPTNLKERAKQMRFLQYRGFTHEQIGSVFRNEDDTL